MPEGGGGNRGSPDQGQGKKPLLPLAHHLARLVYRMLRYGRQYVEKACD
jgi:hypothetical protein